MKHFQIPLAAAAATLFLAASCSVKENRIQCQAPVTVAVSTFSVSQEDIPLTKAQSVAESTDSKPANVKDVRITLSKGGTTFSPVTGFAANDAGFEGDIKLDF